MGYGSLARVYTGWTGTFRVYDDQTMTWTTITPHTRESAASLIARAVHDVLVATGLAISVSVSSAGLVTLSAATSFDLEVSTNCTTRTGFTGTYASGESYTAAGAFSGAYVPANGLKLADPMLGTNRGVVTGDGSGGGVPMRTSVGSSLVAWDSGMSLPDLSVEYDYWHDGRVFGRFIATGTRRVPMSTIRSATTVRIEIDVQEVA